jgi:hypothetical protein
MVSSEHLDGAAVQLCVGNNRVQPVVRNIDGGIKPPKRMCEIAGEEGQHAQPQACHCSSDTLH